MVLLDTSLRSSRCLFLSVEVVIVASDITLGLIIVSALGKVLLHAPELCFLCFISPPGTVAAASTGHEVPLMIPLYLEIST